MLTRARFLNCQTIAEADIEFSPLTVLVGAGRSGKSNIIRALRSAFFNTGSDGFIRHGESKMSVEMWFDDEVFRGETPHLLWEKEKGKGGTYTLNGKTFTKTGGTVPDEVKALLQMHELTVDTVKLTPQLRNHKDTAFLIGETGSKQARILGVLTKLDAIVQCQLNCKKEKDELQRMETAAAAEMQRKQDELDNLPDVEAITAEFDKVKEDAQLVTQAEVVTKSGRSCIVTLHHLESVVSTEELLAAISVEQNLLHTYERVMPVITQYQHTLTAQPVPIKLASVINLERTLLIQYEQVSTKVTHYKEARNVEWVLQGYAETAGRAWSEKNVLFAEARTLCGVCEECPYV